MTRMIPIGIQDFRKIREGGYLYVDKTEMIPGMLSSGSKVHQITRPRCFGKSLNLSMLDAFFNIKHPRDNTWFDGLKVSDCRECDQHRNAYPVICFDFKELSVSSMDVFNADLADVISDLYRQHKYLLDSDTIDDADREYFNAVLHRRLEPARLRKSISSLCRMLHEHHGRKVAVLFDEYDNPVLNAYGKPHQQTVLGVMRDTLSSTLKGNESLAFGVVTGVMQIAKESIFSGLNNLEVNNIFSSDFDEMFGFTDDEVRAICMEYDHPEKYDEAREWYDGYRFGNADVYNPWSVLKYVKSGFVPRTYWAGTSGNSIIDTLLDNADGKTFEEMGLLARGVPVAKTVDPTVTFADLRGKPDNIYSVMVMSGYLRAEPSGRSHMLSLPNGEMCTVFGEMVSRYLERRCGDSDILRMIGELTDAILEDDIPVVGRSLSGLFHSSLGYMMLDSEHVYQAFIAAILLNLSRRYDVTAEFERGEGRYDILLESKVPGPPHVVIELKRSDSDAGDDRVLSDARRALEQISKKGYATGLRGNVLMYGIAFRGKEPTIVSDRMSI